MLSRWLNEQGVQVVDRVEDWVAALECCARPLREQGAINEAYLPAIVAGHRKLGPYYVLAPGLAMPHARPEEGALALGLSLLKLKQGVNFGSSANDPVTVIVMFAAPDKHSHIGLIAGLAELFTDEERMSRIYQAETREEIIALLKTS